MPTATLLLLLSALGTDEVVPEAATWSVEPLKERSRRDVVAVEVEGDRLVIVVTHRVGIDGVSIRPDTGTWPKEVAVRFERFAALESFTATTPKRRAESSLGFGKEKSRVNVGTHDPNTKDRKPLGEVRMPIVRREKRIEVELPPEMIPRGRDALTLNWIDAFRG